MTATNNQMYISGPGSIIWTQKTDDLGGLIAVPQPATLAVLQEHNIEEKKSIKKLFGDRKRVVAIMHGTMDTSIDLKVGTLDCILLNQIYYGTVAVNGTLSGLSLDSSAGTAVPTTPFTITPTVPNSGTFEHDKGVINAVTLKRFTRLASGTPAAGQYTVNESTGVYTFSSADNVAGVLVLINFSYTATVTDSNTLTIGSNPIGPGVIGQLDIVERSSTGSYRKLTYTNVVCSDYKSPSKQEDFMIHELKFDPFAVGNSFASISEYNA